MLQTNINPKDPFSLILANDTRFSNESHTNENVWEIQYDSGELGGISLYSTLSLRALGMRITPIFSTPGENVLNLNQFYKEPTIESLCPNYVRISVEIFQNIIAKLEYWLPNSNSIYGQVSLINSSPQIHEGSLQYMVNLKPFPGGDQMSWFQSELNNYLKGRTKDFFPVFFISGNTQSGKFGQSSIESKYSIKMDDVYKIQWCMAFNENSNQSIKTISNLLSVDFEKESARIELNTQSERFTFETGNSDWDNALLASQHAASQLIIKNPLQKDKFWLVESLHPEKNNFTNEDNKNQILEGVSPLQLWYFSRVLPNQKFVIEDQLTLFFQSQRENGFIPNNTNQDNFQSRFHAFPILAKITYEILLHQNSAEKAHQYLSKIIRYLKYWLITSSKKGVPYWENPMQSLYEDFPIHNYFDETGNAIDTHWIESPFLNTLLHQECEYCLAIAKFFEIQNPEIEWLEQQKLFLINRLQTAWNPKLRIFRYQDIETNRTTRKISILKVNQSGDFKIQKTLMIAQRLNIKVLTKKEITRNVRIEITGNYNNGEINEVIIPKQFFWSKSYGFATSHLIYDQITQISISHLPEGNPIEISTADFSHVDLSCCAPLILPEIDSQKKEKIRTFWLEKEFSAPFGLPMVPKKYQNKDNQYQNLIDVPLNTMILESLIHNNEYHLAREIFSNLMEVVIKNLRNLKKFYKLYNAIDGTCTGDYNIINGMIPLRSYLNLLGIHRWEDNEIEFSGPSFFEEEVTIRHRGIKIICSKDGHTINTSSGKIVELKDKNKHKVKIPR